VEWLCEVGGLAYIVYNMKKRKQYMGKNNNYEINMPLSCNKRFIHLNLVNYIKRFIWNIETHLRDKPFKKA
jgi:hypothetical protein